MTQVSPFSDGIGADISRWLDEHADALAETAMDLIRIPTQVPPGENYPRVVESLLPVFAEMGFDARRLDVPPEVFEERSRVHYPELQGERANLLATMPATGRPKLVVYTHLDTVPVGERERWSFDPLQPFVRDGKLWGRGAADPKGGAAAIVWAFRALHALGIEPAADPIVALTTDEEVGPYTGLHYMADTGVFEGARWLLTPDGLATCVGHGLVGAFTWTVRVRGRGGHSGLSHLCVNPIERCGPLLAALLELKRRVEARRSAVTLSPDVMEAVERDCLFPLLNVTIATGGVRYNAVPTEFELAGDRRYLPEEDEAACIEELREAVRSAEAADPELSYEVETRPFYTSFAGDREDPWVQRVAELASVAYGEPIVPAGLPGSSDVSYTVESTGMQLAMLGSGRLDCNAHGIDERAELRDLVAAAKTIALLVATWTGEVAGA